VESIDFSWKLRAVEVALTPGGEQELSRADDLEALPQHADVSTTTKRYGTTIETSRRVARSRVAKRYKDRGVA